MTGSVAHVVLDMFLLVSGRFIFPDVYNVSMFLKKPKAELRDDYAPAAPAMIVKWNKVPDPVSGRYYYFNPVTFETRWELPKTDLPKTDLPKTDLI